MKLHKEEGDVVTYICQKCQEKCNRGITVVHSFVCTVCHKDKNIKKQGIVFKTSNYDEKQTDEQKASNARYANDARHRIRINGEKEWICRSCNMRLRPRGIYIGGFRPCRICSSGKMCDAKSSASLQKCKTDNSMQHPQPDDSSLTQTFADVVKMGTSANIGLQRKQYLPKTDNPWFWRIVLGHFAEKNGYDELENYIKNEHGNVLTKLPVLPRFQGTTQQLRDKFDESAFCDMPHHHGLTKPFPIRITGNGNCFPNTLSHIVFGNENHSEEMRVRLTIDAVVNKEHYLDSVTLRNGFVNGVPPDNFVQKYLMYSLPPSYVLPKETPEEDWLRIELYEQLTLELSRNGCWSNIWQYHQAANVLQCKVKGIFPDWREAEKQLFHREFLPLGRDVHGAQTVHVMFCRSSEMATRANHFVPVVEQMYDSSEVNIAVRRKKQVSRRPPPPIITVDDGECSTQQANKQGVKQGPDSCMDSLDTICVDDTDFFINNGRAPSTPGQVKKLQNMSTPQQGVGGVSKTPHRKRKQQTPKKVLQYEAYIQHTTTSSSRRKQQRPQKVKAMVNANGLEKSEASARRKMFQTETNQEVTEADDFLPLMESIDASPKKKTESRKQKDPMNTHDGPPQKKKNQEESIDASPKKKTESR